jgi:hypothetical protein
MVLMTGRYDQMQQSYGIRCRRVYHLLQEHLLLMMLRREMGDPGHLRRDYISISSRFALNLE